MRCREESWPRDIKVFLENSRSIPCREYLQVTDRENRTITAYSAFKDGETITPVITTTDVPIYGYRVEYLVDGIWRGSHRSLAGGKHCLKGCFQGRRPSEILHFGHIQPVPLQYLLKPEPENNIFLTQPGNSELGCLEICLYLDYTETTHDTWFPDEILPWYFQYHQTTAVPQTTGKLMPTYCICFQPLQPPPASYQPGRHVAPDEEPWATFRFLYRASERLEHLPYPRTGMPRLPGTTIILSPLRGQSRENHENPDMDIDVKEEFDIDADIKEESDMETDVEDGLDTITDMVEQLDMDADMEEAPDLDTDVEEESDAGINVEEEPDTGVSTKEGPDADINAEGEPDIYSKLEAALTLLESTKSVSL